jgi:SRSO17 transposase
VAVSLLLAGNRGSAPIAFQLCLPQDWADDALATKSAIALAQMRLAISQSVLLADGACDDETVFRDGLRALGLLCPVSIRPATTVGAPGAVQGPRSYAGNRATSP